MAVVSPNMGLRQWNSVNDLYNHTELSNNFAAIDSHDHTGGPSRGLQIPSAGLTNLAVVTSKIADLNVTTAKVADLNVTTAKLANQAVTASKVGVLPHARAFNNVNQTIASGIISLLSFNSERYDTDSIHDLTVSSSRLTCRTAGLYAVFASIRWSANASGYRKCEVLLNGATTIASTSDIAVPGIETDQSLTTQYRLNALDYVEIRVLQNSGAGLDVVATGADSPEVSISFLSNF